MDKAAYDQITALLEKSQKILLLTHAKADCDGLGAALASYLVLKKLGKDVTIATNDPAPENLKFLPSIDILQNSLAGSADFLITLDTTKTSIDKIKYNVEGNKVNIVITPKSGSFSEEDVIFEHGKNKYDLIFVLDTGNLEHLGPIYDRNVEMFYETPVINIDHHSSNTDFGQVNLVNVTAASTTEILYEYLAYLEKKYDKKLITEDVATLLLAGIITDTGSFQHANTSPHSMETASKLLDLGARQQEIIKNIYKTKKLSTLKLWGIILSKIQVDPIHRIVWSTISKEDFQEADADPDETEGILDDLLTNAPGAEVIFLIKYNPEYTSVSMRSTGSQIDVGKFCAENGGGGHARAAGFKVRNGRPFDQIASEVVAKVRKFQAGRLNIHEEDLKKPIGAPMGAPMGAPIGETEKQPIKPVQPDIKSEGEDRHPPQEKPKPEQPQETTYLDFKAPGKKDNKQKNAVIPTEAKPSGWAKKRRRPRRRPKKQPTDQPRPDIPPTTEKPQQKPPFPPPIEPV